MQNIKVSPASHDGRFGGDIVGVNGEVKNLGSRTVSQAELTIYFLDAYGQPMHKEVSHSVFSLSPDDLSNQPLPPNYTQTFKWGFRGVGSDFAWRVLVRVTDVQFAK